ncbi:MULTISPECIES: UvrD-helicase domain-containing protein [unclassified Brevibacterium]|uniref:UvrD-helicase domain-containing protein n=1 Tax=unclassified Brevibacterium TaxID=2614124 RepID=UPI001E361A5A|nr:MULTISPECIES: UvrD-helicase domain-containing protein [unclassified Brevibacterium]MCD1284268.1 ATP-dependent DNA helicase PcrA [Brevibacterium sp. CCUG 69071]MDK8436122.1 3'-5' exonuclease [Brevibacterium sp. H-BE7]
MTAAAEHPAKAAAGADSRTAELLTGLNPRQREAVIHTGSPLLIVAGAGSGKTTVLTRRIAYALATGRAHPGEVLAITFTNKAAKEMAERVSTIVGPASRAMWVSTFHSSCVRILRREAKVLGMKSNFTIYDAQDAQRLVSQILKELGLDTKKYAPRAMLHRISNLKNDLQTPDDFSPRPNNPADEVLADVFKRYTSRLRLANAFDFDDLIAETVHLFGAFPEVADSYRRRFRHILVDEYQDTNPAQYALIRALAGDGAGGPSGAELTVVGDADQSIYAFRGATVRNIVEFEKDFPDAETILLEQNYRSTQNILDAANAVIANNEDRREKKLWTSEGSGRPIIGWVAENEQAEARFIVDRIDDLIDEEKYTYGDFAVFYRTNAQSRAIEDALVRSGIPYKVVGGTRFYERKEIKDALAYLRVVANPDDDVNLRRILNVPKRSIGDRTEGIIADFADREGISFYTALGRLDEIAHLSSRAASSVAKFYDLMQDLATIAEAAPLSRVIEAILEQSGYLESLQKSTDPQDESRVDNLAELVAVAEDFVATQELAATEAEAEAAEGEPTEGDVAEGESTSESAVAEVVAADAFAGVPTEDAASEDRTESVPETDEAATEAETADGPAPGAGAASIEQFLEQVALASDTDQIPDAELGQVTLMTLHTAKGLEFPVVFLTGLEDGGFPHARSFENPNELSEERRLAYVGLTRARQRLLVSRAETRSMWGQPQYNPPSRFLAEIPENLIEWESTGSFSSALGSGFSSGGYGSSGYGSGSGGYGSGSGGFGSSRGGSSRGFGGSSRSRSTSSSSGPVAGFPNRIRPNREVITVAVGEKVSHESFGLGTVTEVNGVGDKTVAVVDFGSLGSKRLLLRYAPIEKLG